ncbi:MAG TPA: 1-deoxy-D-xylulose-5-phosphate reductoisomerase [Clostridiales bacterium]|jgi:1-deoxy-D-xylulose-5-phosphate reductoisomerase|nr:1-deoxy-D-xylulose-5-phosphate reductoisomerase [Clostridiales bacterium]
MKYIALLGSTGSVGTQVLDVVRSHGHRFRICAMSAGHNIDLFASQLEEFRPEFASVACEQAAAVLSRRFPDIRFSRGMEGLCETASCDQAHTVVNALVGMIGLQPTAAAILTGKDVALANKETLVAGGALIMSLAKKKNVRLLPVDSEHSAIFQCLQNQAPADRLTLTASGGPFRGYTREQLRSVTKEQALAHPNWTMGEKITVDSATMMNKGLEVIEARWLFDIPPERIDVVVHPESILHSAVSFVDGSLIGQFGWPDMKIPIAYALSYPDRLPDVGKRLDLADAGCLRFERPDEEAFPCLRLAREALLAGGSYPVVLNAANEEAVAAFLRGTIPFHRIAECIEEVLSSHRGSDAASIEGILEEEQRTRASVRSLI